MRRPPRSALTKIKLFVLDMDGTVHIGGRIFPFARAFFEEVKKASQSAFGIVIDTGHSNIAGDLCGAPQLAGRRLYYLHIHDNDAKADQHQMPRNGTIDWKRFIDDLQQADYRGPLMLEVAPRRGELPDVLTEAKRSAEYLLSLMKSG